MSSDAWSLTALREREAEAWDEWYAAAINREGAERRVAWRAWLAARGNLESAASRVNDIARDQEDES